MAPVMAGTLNLLRATIDWRDETAQCLGIFRSDGATALEVEYKVVLDDALLDLLARAFLKAGLPLLRGSKTQVEVPSITPIGDTLGEFRSASDAPKLDRRTRAWRDQQRALRDAPPNGNTT